MMQGISKDIYEALFVSDVIVTAPNASDSLGDTTTQEPITYKGYLYEHNEKVLNALGQEVLSGMQIYLRGEDVQAIDIHSKISCDQVKNSPILARAVYRGKKGSRVIGVLYLP